MSLFTNKDTGLGRPKYLRLGQVRAINLTAGGTGYTSAPTVVIDAPPAGGVQATATAVLTGTVVTSIVITNPGAGYVTVPLVTFTGGAGTGAAATTSIKRGKGLIKAADIIFVDQTEAAVPANRLKGIRGPGWWRVKQRYDQDGNIRYTTELLVAMNVPFSISGDAENAIAANINAIVTINTQPTNQTTVTGGATFGVTATIAPSGNPTYQWQTRATATNKWSVVNGATNATIVLTSQTSANTGNQYRVIVGSDNGATLVTSTAATLTFGS